MTYKIIGKYIKDLKFSIPNAKIFFSLSKDIANYKINIDIKSNQVKENIIEVFTSLRLIPTKNDTEKIETNIVYCSVVELTKKNINKKEMEKIVLIQVPSEVYSELRKIFVNLFENSGFKDIKINKNVDFQELYNRKRIQ